MLPAELEVRGAVGWISGQEFSVGLPRLPGVLLENARVSDTRPSRTMLPATQPGQTARTLPWMATLGATN